MYTPALSSSSASQDISVSRFIRSTAGADSHELIGLLIFGVQNTTEKLFRCDAAQASLIDPENTPAFSDTGGTDMSVIETTPLKNLSAYISLMKLQGDVPAGSYLNAVQHHCEQAIRQQDTTTQASDFSPYLSARTIAATPDRKFNSGMTEAARQQNTRLAETLTQLKFSKEQMTGQRQKIAENHAKPFLRTPVDIITGEIDLAGLNRLYDANPG